MGQLNKNLPQDIEEVGDNDLCAKASMEYDEDSRRGKYNDHGDKKNHSESKYQ